MLLIAFILSGCGKNPSGPANTPLLTPLQGSWAFDINKTLTLWQAQGKPANQIAMIRSMNAMFPIHPDMRIKDNTAVLNGVTEGEYYFFALHQHNPWTCGKAWHHEDRHDPGDMSKCYVRLEIKNADLHLSLRILEDPINLNDPDLTNMPITAGNANTCIADSEPDPPWSAWETYIFTKQ